METELANLILMIPNLAVALWALWRDDKRMEKLLDVQKWLIEQLMSLHPPQEKPGEPDEK